jgi:hypothetical protein
MRDLSINTAWNEASAFVRREAGLLFPIVFLLGSLPGAAAQLLAPQQGSTPTPGEAGAWLLVFLAAILLGFIANLAIAYLALRPGRSVGEGLGRAGRRFLPMLGAMLIVSIAAGLLLFVLAMVVTLLMPGAAESMAAGGPPGPEALAAIGIVFLLMAPVLIYVAPRLVLMTPVAAVEEAGPLAIIRRSWQLSKGNFWKLLGFILLFVIVFIVITMAVSFVVGALVVLLVGRPDPGSLAMLIMLLIEAVIGAIFSMFFGATAARLYAQLAEDNVAEVFR